MSILLLRGDPTKDILLLPSYKPLTKSNSLVFLRSSGRYTRRAGSRRASSRLYKTITLLSSPRRRRRRDRTRGTQVSNVGRLKSRSKNLTSIRHPIRKRTRNNYHRNASRRRTRSKYATNHGTRRTTIGSNISRTNTRYVTRFRRRPFRRKLQGAMRRSRSRNTRSITLQTRASYSANASSARTIRRSKIRRANNKTRREDLSNVGNLTKGFAIITVLLRYMTRAYSGIRYSYINVRRKLVTNVDNLLTFSVITVGALRNKNRNRNRAVNFRLNRIRIHGSRVTIPRRLFRSLVFLYTSGFLFRRGGSSSLLTKMTTPTTKTTTATFFTSVVHLSVGGEIETVTTPVATVPELLEPELLTRVGPAGGGATVSISRVVSDEVPGPATIVVMPTTTEPIVARTKRTTEPTYEPSVPGTAPGGVVTTPNERTVGLAAVRVTQGLLNLRSRTDLSR